MNLSNASEEVNNLFRPIKLLAIRPTPASPNYEAFVDIELWGFIQLRQIRIARNRFGKVLTRLPETFAARPGGKPVATVWIADPIKKAQFDEAVSSVLPTNTEVPK